MNLDHADHQSGALTTRDVHVYEVAKLMHKYTQEKLPHRLLSCFIPVSKKKELQYELKRSTDELNESMLSDKSNIIF